MSNEKQRPIDWDKVTRVLIRSFPFSLAPVPEIFDLLKDLQQSRSSLDEKVKNATVALHSASGLVTELQAELSQRIEQVKKLREEYEKYEKLAKIEEDKAKVLIQQIQKSVGEGKAKERWIALGINLAAGIIIFFLGVWLSTLVTELLGGNK